jgi:hypothetical protein
VVGHYESFFSASAGASAAILGLLVVAVSVVNADDADPTTRELRTVLAGSAFVVLVDVFFVSIVALTGGAVVFGLSSIAMATVGLLATRRLIPRAKRAGNFSPSSRNRKLNLAFASISVVGRDNPAGIRRTRRLFFFPLFSDGSRGSFVAALLGPGEFWWDIWFFVLLSFGRRARRNRLHGEFAGPKRFATEAAGSIAKR